jgi:hypothetical protein
MDQIDIIVLFSCFAPCMHHPLSAGRVAAIITKRMIAQIDDLKRERLLELNLEGGNVSASPYPGA